MSRPYRLSVLDQSPILPGGNAAGAVANSIDLAQLCDVLGYDRYWLAEHHASPGLAGCAPEVLIGPIARATHHIRVGSGGIMLPHYSPYKVAGQFELLAALAPGRIDLGVGRAPGGDGRSSIALQRDRSMRMRVNDFPQQLAELLAYLSDSLPADHPFAPLAKMLPGEGAGGPAPWLLGSSMDSARWAAETGLPYCFADFINPHGQAMAELYHREFRPSHWLDRPRMMTAVWTIAAPTRPEAEALIAPMMMLFAHYLRGQLIPLPTMEVALAWLEHNPPPVSAAHRRVLGTPAEVRAQLDAVAREYQAEELMLVNILADHQARRHSYTLIAEEYGLARGSIAA